MASNRKHQSSKGLSEMVKLGVVSDSSEIYSPSGNLLLPAPPSSTENLCQITSDEQREAKESTLHSALKERLKHILLDDVFQKQATENHKVIQVHLIMGKSFSVSISVQRSLIERFCQPLSDQLAMSQCSDITLNLDTEMEVEAFTEAFMMLHHDNKDSRLMRIRKADVSKVVAILKACNKMGFRRGLISCLDILEAMPWEGREDISKVVCAVKALEENNWLAADLQKRLTGNPNTIESVVKSFMRILNMIFDSGLSVLTRMRPLMSELLILVRKMAQQREEILMNSLNEKLFSMIHEVFSICSNDLSQIEDVDNKMGNENLIHWEFTKILSLFECMVAAKIGNHLLDLWMEEEEINVLYEQMVGSIRYPISIIVSQFVIWIGNGSMIVNLQSKNKFLKLWLRGLYEDFPSLKELPGFSCRELEVALSKLFLTLSLDQQEEYFVE